MNFIPLHIYSGYSILQSGLSLERIFEGVTKNKFPGCGLTDKNILSGTPAFYNGCLDKNIKPIIGLDINYSLCDHNFLVSLFAIDEDSYLALVKISSFINKAEFDKNEIVGEFKKVICVLSTISNPFNVCMDNPRELMKFSNLFKGFYLGIENYSNKELEKINQIREFAKSHSYDTVAFPCIKYLKPSDAIVLDIVDAIANDKTLEEKESNGPFYFPSEEIIKMNYTDEEIENTCKILNLSSFDFNKKRGQILKVAEINARDELIKLCQKSLSALNLNNEVYNKRLKYEIDVISSMGYCDYFLIVADYVRYAKDHNILVGPGRGSAAGSLVAYLLNITTIDPLKYDLLFERFLNKDRVSMPDIDIDFEDIKRNEIVSYLISKYGDKRVSNIITFQTIGAKQSIRDIGRVYQYPARIIEQLSKAIPDNKIDLHNAYRKAPAFKALIDSDELYLEVVRLASKIEGLPRQSSIHAAGIVLSNETIANKMPVIKDGLGLTIAQFEMNNLENQGFLKMDLLGLRNLTIIHKCLDLIKVNRGVNLDYYQIPYDTPEIYKMIAKGYNVGIFQLETNGFKKPILNVKPTCFDDIVALLALNRPGPMEFIPTYAERKNNGKKIEYIVPELEPILKSTYGIMVYQEQIMQITQVTAGFTLGEADIFRRAISKKDVSKMEKLKDKFISGCLNNGYTKAKAEELYSTIVKFANYGFNKSHSVAYSVITCQMAYLKYKYPFEFFTALLEIGSSSSDTKFQEYISEMKKMGIKLFLPDINVSSYEYVIHQDGLMIPLSSIHGISNQVVDTIIAERTKNGPYEDFANFVVRLFPFSVNEQHFTKLIDAGALDGFDKSRASLRANLPSYIRFAQIFAGDKPQGNIFYNDYKNQELPRYRKVEDNPLENFQYEYEALGITISKTILTYKKQELEAKNIKTISYLIEKDYPRGISFACILKSSKVIKTKKGEPMAFLKVFDEDNELEVTVFPTLYSQSIMKLQNNEVLIIAGTYQKDKESFIADSIELMPKEEK